MSSKVIGLPPRSLRAKPTQGKAELSNVENPMTLLQGPGSHMTCSEIYALIFQLHEPINSHCYLSPLKVNFLMLAPTQEYRCRVLNPAQGIKENF